MFIELVKGWLIWPYLVIFFFSCYFTFKKLRLVWFKLWGLEFKKAHIALLIAFVVAVPFFFWTEGPKSEVMVKLMVSYTVGTSLYELVLKQIESFIKRRSDAVKKG